MKSGDLIFIDHDHPVYSNCTIRSLDADDDDDDDDERCWGCLSTSRYATVALEFTRYDVTYTLEGDVNKLVRLVNEETEDDRVGSRWEGLRNLCSIVEHIMRCR